MNRCRNLILIFGALVLAGCSQSPNAQNNTTPINTLPLTETYVFPGFGFSIDYPQGWLTDTNGTNTWIMQTEEDFSRRHTRNLKVSGIAINLDHRTINWLRRAYDLEENPTLNDLFDLNIHAISHMVNPEIVETTIFGVDALQSEFYGVEEQWYVSYAGFIGDEAFLLMIAAPSEEALQDFKPTWEAMVESISVVEE